MSPIEKLKDWLIGPSAGRPWGADCPAHTPVPAPDRCPAVDCDSIPVTLLGDGERGRVTCLETPDGPAARKLLALGILPGIEVAVLQRKPAFVLRSGHTDLALDSALASQIRVRREGTPRFGDSPPPAVAGTSESQ